MSKFMTEVEAKWVETKAAFNKLETREEKDAYLLDLVYGAYLLIADLKLRAAPATALLDELLSEKETLPELWQGGVILKEKEHTDGTRSAETEGPGVCESSEGRVAAETEGESG